MEIQLPSHFNSWYHLWKEIEKNGLLNERKVFFLKEEADVNLSVEKHEFFISDIKEMLLKELLEQKWQIQEFTFEDLIQIERVLSKTGFRTQVYSEDGLLQKVKANINQLYDERVY